MYGATQGLCDSFIELRFGLEEVLRERIIEIHTIKELGYKGSKNKWNMKRVRVINGIVWGAIVVWIIVEVLLEWHASGCGAKSLCLAWAFYGVTGTGLWFIVDTWLREHDEDKH